MCPPLGDQTQFLPGNVGTPSASSQNSPSGQNATQQLTNAPGAASLAQLGNLLSLENWVSYFGRTGSPLTRQPAPVQQTNPGGTATPGVFAVALKASFTGIFKVSLGVEFTGVTPGDTFNLALLSGASAGPGVLGGPSFVSTGIAGASAVNAQAVVQAIDAAGGTAITFDGVQLAQMTGGSTIAFTGTQGVTIPNPAPGNGTLVFNYEGIVGSAAKTKSPFPIGQTVCFGLVCTGIPAGETISFGNAYLSAVEWPFQ